MHQTILNLAGLLDLANLYCEEKLKKKCERLIKQSISVDNAAMLLDASIKYNAKVSNVANSPLLNYYDQSYKLPISQMML